MAKAGYKANPNFYSQYLWLSLVGLGIISGAGYLFNFKLLNFLPGFSHTTEIAGFLVLFLSLGVVYLVGVWFVLHNTAKIGTSKSLLSIILFFAILFRLCMVSTAPTALSDDMYRYIWDGRVQQSGINPYLFVPEADELESLRDDRIYPEINRKNYPTIYPAAAQLFFRLFHVVVGDSVTGFKGFMVFFDVLTLLILTALLQIYGFAATRLIIYAWNPLVIFEIAYSGHLEGLTVFFMVAAFYLNALAKNRIAVIMLAVASAIKLYPALLLAAFLNRGERIKGILLFGGAIALLYLPYAAAGRKIIGFLPSYLNNPYESFNLALKSLVLRILPGLDYYLLSQMFILALLVAGAIIFAREKHNIQKLKAAYSLVGMLLILMPAALHPWYVILIVPFLTFFPNLAWLLFTITVALSYIKYISPGEIMPAWVLLAEYLPLFILLTAGYFYKNRKNRH